MPRKRKRRAAGEGCIINLPDGRFAAKIRAGHDAVGKPILLKKEFKTEKQAQEWLTKTRFDQQAGAVVTQTRMTVAQLLDRWMEEVVQRRVKPKTIVHYEGMVKHLKEGPLAGVQIAKLTTPRVQAFLNEKLDSGLAPKTVKHIRDTLRAALNVAMDEWELIQKNPAKKASPGRIEKPAIRVFTVSEATRFLEAVRGHRLEALFTVAIALGLRRGEALGLRWSDYDTGKKTLRIEKSLDFLKGQFVLGDTKTPKSRSTLPLLPFAVAALDERGRTEQEDRKAAGEVWAGNDWNLIFTTSVGTPIIPRNLQRTFDAILRRAGLPKIRLHDLRHSVVTLLLARGVPLAMISRYIRHASILTTMDLYGHLAIDDLTAVTDALESVFAPDEEPD